MNVQTNVNRPKPTLVNPRSLAVGKVYSWGAKSVSYLRVQGGSVSLGNWEFIPLSHVHFSNAGAGVQVADKADLTITYED